MYINMCWPIVQSSDESTSNPVFRSLFLDFVLFSCMCILHIDLHGIPLLWIILSNIHSIFRNSLYLETLQNFSKNIYNSPRYWTNTVCEFILGCLNTEKDLLAGLQSNSSLRIDDVCLFVL